MRSAKLCSNLPQALKRESFAALGSHQTRLTKEEVGRQHQGMDRPEFSRSQSAVENREKWRKLVAKSSVVPQQPSRFKD